jgi:arylsulfatase A-like enzyme
VSVSLIGLGALLAVSPGAAFAAEPAPARQPNVVLIMADDLSAAELSCYGQRRYRTPNLDRLASQGIRFTDCYSGAPVCAPSRSVLLTGQHNGRTRIRANDGVSTPDMPAPGGRVPLYPADNTIAKVMKGAGCATACVGKWGLGNEDSTGEPLKQGFDHFFGYLDQRLAHNHYPETLRDDRKQIPIEANAGGKQGVYSQDLFLERSLAFIESNRDRPFFLYAAWTLPHVDLAIPKLNPGLDPTLSSNDATYASMVTRLDQDVGRILDQLDKLNLSSNTLVVFTSDNGAADRREGVFDSCGPFSGEKYSLKEGGIRVPMICRMPGTVPAGKVSAAPWYFADVLPTLAELANVPAPGQLDGISVLPLLTGKTDVLPDRLLYWETITKYFGQAARWRSYKAIRTWSTGAMSIYDLSVDPGEKTDISAIHPELVTRFETFLRESHRDSPHYPKMVASCPDWKAESAKWEEKLKGNPRSPDVLSQYSWFLLDTLPDELKNIDRALELANEANELAGGKDRDILDTLSEICFVRKDYAHAVDYSRKSLEPGLQGKGKVKALQKQLAKCEKALAETIAAATPVTHAEDGMSASEQPVIEETFDKDLSNWVSEGPNAVSAKDGKLVIKATDAAKLGQYVWLKQDLPADFRLEFDFTPKSPSGFFLLFFCAKGTGGEDILGDGLMKEYKAEKDFKKYTIGPINCYHISYRRNESADCNLRKNTGKHLLSNSKVDQLIPANQTARVVLAKQGGHITLTVDGVAFMDFTDDGKLNNGIYGAGKFGFRQVYESEGQYDNFRVFDLGKR